MESKRIDTLLKARFKACGKLGEGKVRNLSLGGLFVATSSVPPPGESVRVGFRLPNGRVADVSGLVWWNTVQGGNAGKSHRAQGFGLRVVDSNPEYENGVREMIQAKAARF